MDATAEYAFRELDHRCNDGIDVTMLWDSRTDAIVIAVEDSRAGDSFELAVDPDDAVDAFRHPYAYEHRLRRITAHVPIS